MDKTQTIHELRAVVNEKFGGEFPTFAEIRKSYSSLGWHIEKYGGYLHIRKMMGCNVEERKPPNYWNQWNNLQREIKTLIINNRFPTVEQIHKEFGNGAYKAIVRLGGICEVAKKMGCEKLVNKLVASDGHHVQSSYEYLVDEFLYANRVPHEVGSKIHSSSRCRCDFKIGDWHIEIWGYNKKKNKRNETYVKKRRKKEQLYKQLGLKLISLEASLFVRPAEEIKEFLDGMLNTIGMTEKEEFKIQNYIHHTRYWNYDNTLAQLQYLIEQLGRFPSITDMATHNPRLRYGVARHGGLCVFQKTLGYKQRNRWTKESIVHELNKIIRDSGQFPTCRELKEAKRTGLLTAISQQGGINWFRSEMGYPVLKKYSRRLNLAGGQESLP